MFIAIIGPTCAGKQTIEKYLVLRGFTAIKLVEDNLNMVPDTSSFKTPSEILDFVTKNWRKDFVTTTLTPDTLADFVVRPFFLLIRVNAPMLFRWKSACIKAIAASRLPPSLETFVQENDRRADSERDFPTASTLSIRNNFDSVLQLYEYLYSLPLNDPERLRPGWDSYFMTLAHLASLRSNCMKRRVGAILVRNKRILSTGYNGTPRGLTNCNEGGCGRCNGGSDRASGDECLCLHAEENALLEAGRERVGDDGVLYCNTCPCLRCSIKIVQTGVREVVYNLGYKMDDATAKVFTEAGVILRQHSPSTI